MIEVSNTLTEKPEYTHWFFYGFMRSGKTRAASTFPTPFFIVPHQEGSHVSLLGTDTDYVLVHGSTGPEQKVARGKAYSMDAAVSFLEERHAAAAKLWQKGDDKSLDKASELFPWQTVVIESVTHYTDLVQQELTRNNTIDMDQQKWGKLSAHLRTIHARLSALPVHVVFIALAIEKHDQKGNCTFAGPAFPGNMNYKLPSACDCVVFMGKRDGATGSAGRYTAYFSKHGMFDAGCRFPALTSKGSVTPFTFSEVQNLLG